MALRVDFRDAPAAQQDELTERQQAVYTALCISSMVCAVGSILPKTLDQFMARLDFYQNLHGGLLYGVDDEGNACEVKVTREDVEDFVPFVVNVSPITKTAFLKNVIDNYRSL